MIKVGISSCLLGNSVRYDGGHRNNRFCNEQLTDYFDFESFCPEVGIGLPIPRKTIRLEGNSIAPKAIMNDENRTDLTGQLKAYAKKNIEKIQKLNGFVFCKGSPSCGTNRVKVYNDSGQAQKNGMGIFAAEIQMLIPELPTEDDGRLQDPLIRDSFIKRVFIYSEWRALLKSGITVRKIHEFHARHKFTLLSHNQPTLRRLGKMLAAVDKKNLESASKLYIEDFMQGLTKVATRKNNTNALLHLQGFLKHTLNPSDKKELTRCIHDYLRGLEPLLSPIRLLKHHFRRHPHGYANNQSFLNPYPKELGIRVKAL